MTVSNDKAIKWAQPITNDVPFPPCNSIYVGGAGDVQVQFHNSTSTATFKSVPVGTFLPVHADKVIGAGTTASLLLACGV